MAEIKYDVFISYSRKDYLDENNKEIQGNVVSIILERLTKEGISYWIDKDEVHSGDSFTDKITDNIEASSVFVYLSSANANSSRWTCKEISTADEFGKYIIPVKIDETPYHRRVLFRIADYTYIPYYANPEQGLNELITSIKTYLAKQKEDARKAEEEKEREREAARKRAEELKRQKELEERQHKAEQQRIYNEIKLRCEDLNNQENKQWWERRTLISQTERIEDPAQKEKLSSYISTSSPIRKKIEEEFKSLLEKVKELEMTIQSLTQKKVELVQANGDLAKTNGELTQRIEALEKLAKTTEQERKSIARIGQLQNDLKKAKDEADKNKKNWYYWYYEWKGKKKFCWFLGITVLLFLVTFAFFWLHGNIKFSSHGDIKPTPKTFLYKDSSKAESLTSQQLTSKGIDYYYGRKWKKQNYGSAFLYFRDAAEQGDASGQDWLGWMYQNGYGVEQNYTEAVKWYQKAAEEGNAAGQNNLGWMYQNGYGVEQNYKEAAKWYQTAAEQGNKSAQNNLGDAYYFGNGVDKDYGEALKWFQKAAEQGHASGQYNLGWMYEHGYGVEKDLIEAKKWYQKAAGNGHKEAKKRLKELN